MMPVIPLLVKTEETIPYLRWYFFLYTVWTALTYCYSYRDVLITAYQEDYKRLNIANGIIILTTIIQIAALLKGAGFTLYLLIAIVGTIITNLLIYRKAGRLYPYLEKYKTNAYLLRSKRVFLTTSRQSLSIKSPCPSKLPPTV